MHWQIGEYYGQGEAGIWAEEDGSIFAGTAQVIRTGAGWEIINIIETWEVT